MMNRINHHCLAAGEVKPPRTADFDNLMTLEEIPPVEQNRGQGPRGTKVLVTQGALFRLRSHIVAAQQTF